MPSKANGIIVCENPDCLGSIYIAKGFVGQGSVPAGLNCYVV
jgi:aspartate carbamoyltransferase regulatory subunit